MANIAIVTDSVASIPDELVEKYNIFVAPVSITWDRMTYRDNIDLKINEFYKRLRNSKTLPTTSSAIQGEFLTIFERLKGKVDGILTLALSGTLGAAYSTANIAKSMVEGVPIEIIDTNQAMMGEGFPVLAAAKVAAAGGTMEQVIKAANDVLSKIYLYYGMDTLDYLRRGGRVGLPAAVFATWLRIKPIVQINIKVIPIERARTKAKMMDRIVEIMLEKIHSKTPLHVAVMHGDSPVDAATMEQKVRAVCKPIEVITSEITPVIGTHTGPGTLGLAFYNE